MRDIPLHITAFTIAILGASTASAQGPARLGLSIYGVMGAGGELHRGPGYYFGPAPQLPFTGGAGLRVDVPVHDVVAVGAGMQVSTFDTLTWDGREKWLDLPFGYVRVRRAFGAGDDWLEPYATAAAGGMLDVMDQNDEDGTREHTYGWTIALLAGVQYLGNRGSGCFVEVGWIRRSERRSEPIEYWTNQAAIQLGLRIGLGRSALRSS